MDMLRFGDLIRYLSLNFFNCRSFILLKLLYQTQSKNGSNFNSYVTSGRAEERKEPEGQTDEEEGGKGKREEEW